jgi:hypothetical protein
MMREPFSARGRLSLRMEPVLGAQRHLDLCNQAKGAALAAGFRLSSMSGPARSAGWSGR